MEHLSEWAQSCVDEQLTRLNVIPLQGQLALEHLLYAESLPRRNDGRVSERLMERYQHAEQGGWWCSGVDVLTGTPDMWGCFKPDTPRLDRDRRKVIKYEHPPKVPTGLFALRVPRHIWERIAERYNVKLRDKDIDSEQPDLGFWTWFLAHPEVPLFITEGAKKTGTLLTAGYAAIGLPGIHSGYRSPRDSDGTRIGRSALIPHLKRLAGQQREVYIAFDQDTQGTTVQAVNAAVRKLGQLITKAGSQVKVVTWPADLGKGIDDLVANHGQKPLDVACQDAASLDVWKAQSWTRLTRIPDIELAERYLPDVDIPKQARLVGLKSPKGTGKTRFLEKIVADARAAGKWVLVIGHRVRLVEALCDRFGLNYITEVLESPDKGQLGYGLCIDSLHPNSQASFDGEAWRDGVVIIDEVEQVLWHGLNSSTCKDNRVAILRSLKSLLQNVLGEGGQVYVADADLSDVSLDYLLAMAGVNYDPFVVRNNWQPGPELAWQVFSYPEKSPHRLVGNLLSHIEEGGKPFVCLSAQKVSSQWGTCTLEVFLNKRYPDKKILRIDSESLADPNHPAYNCASKLNELLQTYDIVLASPSIETGISIDLRGRFTSVWGIAQGVQAANSVCQALGRVRENLPRHIWVAPFGFNQVGDGSVSIPALLTSGNRLSRLNIRLLQQSDFVTIDDVDTGFQAESLMCWSKMAVRVNAAMLSYRESILAVLKSEGHRVRELAPLTEAEAQKLDALFPAETENDKTPTQKKSTKSGENQLTAMISAVREENYTKQCHAIADSPDLEPEDYHALKKKLVKNVSERQILRKYELQQRYGIPTTVELVIKDDDGWYSRLRLHYFLTVGREYLAERDGLMAKKLISQGEGSLFLPDFNGSQLGATIGIMELLGIKVLIENPERELKNSDPELIKMSELALAHRSEIKAAVGIGIAQSASPVTVARRFLSLMDFGLELLRLEGGRKNRTRVYTIVPPADGRESVFQAWLQKDCKHPGSSELAVELTPSKLKAVDVVAKPVETKPKQKRKPKKKAATASKQHQQLSLLDV
ncbi:MAG: plasmid replication protein, CyRepA1 family [Cyanobacteria bacterium P01_H01_bin.15]